MNRAEIAFSIVARFGAPALKRIRREGQPEPPATLVGYVPMLEAEETLISLDEPSLAAIVRQRVEG